MLKVIIISAILAGCGAGLSWMFADMKRVFQAEKERCESLDEDEE